MDFFFLLTIVFILVCFVGFGRRSRKVLADSAATRAARLKRIQNAGWWIQLLLIISFLFSCFMMLAFFMGWPVHADGKVRIVLSQHHIYTSFQDMPGEVAGWWLLQIAWAGFCYWVMFSLFGLYRQGILFSAKNVRHIRSLGYFLIGNWGLEDQIQTALRDVQLSTTPIFIGLLIIFVSWIMDEGRKIQEEQELTV